MCHYALCLPFMLLNGNQLTGSLPDEIGFLPNFRRLQIHQNKISGSIPKSFANLNKTKHFHMNNNSISGEIPLELFRLPSLIHFLLDNNNLSGPLPAEFSKLPNLMILRLELARMRLKLKLLSIIKEQMMYLEEWALIEKDHSNSLLGASESLRASTLRLPIACGAMMDIQNLKETMCTAFDVLQAMASSICSLLPKVEQMNCLFDEVVSTFTGEFTMLHECRDVLSALAAHQVKDCSLRVHNLQLKQVAPRLPNIEET